MHTRVTWVQEITNIISNISWGRRYWQHSTYLVGWGTEEEGVGFCLWGTNHWGWQGKSGFLGATEPCTHITTGDRNIWIYMGYPDSQREKDALWIMVRNYCSFLSNVWSFKLPSDLGNRYWKTILNGIRLGFGKFFSEEEVRLCGGNMIVSKLWRQNT